MSKVKAASQAVVDFAQAIVRRVDLKNMVAFVVVGVNELGDNLVKAFNIYDLDDAHIIMRNLKLQWERKDGSVVTNPHRGQTPGLKLITKSDGTQVLHVQRDYIQK